MFSVSVQKSGQKQADKPYRKYSPPHIRRGSGLINMHCNDIPGGGGGN